MPQKRKSRFHLRPAEAHEQALIQQMVRDAQLNRFGIHWQNFILAENESRVVVGCGQIKPHKDCRELASIIVLPAWQGQGIARQIIEKLKSDAGKPLWLMCAGNMPHFYKQFNFAEVRKRNKMPLFFRRIAWIVQLIEKLTRQKDLLAIMCWC